MFKLKTEERKQLLQYFWTRPYGEVAALVNMLAALEEQKQNKDDRIKKICPRCMGNGYIRIPNEAVGIPKEIVTQCTMCDSQGEVHYYEEPNYDYNGINTDKLQ